MAVVGKGWAVLQSGKVRIHGLFAWLAWAFIHVTYLAQLSQRISVFQQWGWFIPDRKTRFASDRELSAI
jgi:NADH:ubiquinone reductase (H+-translocating)